MKKYIYMCRYITIFGDKMLTPLFSFYQTSELCISICLFARVAQQTNKLADSIFSQLISKYNQLMVPIVVGVEVDNESRRFQWIHKYKRKKKHFIQFKIEGPLGAIRLLESLQQLVISGQNFTLIRFIQIRIYSNQ